MSVGLRMGLSCRTGVGGEYRTMLLFQLVGLSIILSSARGSTTVEQCTLFSYSSHPNYTVLRV